ncbi:MAG: hypothetical protein JO100_19125 [Pseudonocardia sp.]|nr:hypothetical protein [Pseudonocardia sp.]
MPKGSAVDVLQAYCRQLAHTQAQVFASLRRVSRCTPSVDYRAGRATDGYTWVSGEVAAALTWTPSVADRELDHATQLIDTLPLVFRSPRRRWCRRRRAP